MFPLLLVSRLIPEQYSPNENRPLVVAHEVPGAIIADTDSISFADLSAVGTATRLRAKTLQPRSYSVALTRLQTPEIVLSVGMKPY